MAVDSVNNNSTYTPPASHRQAPSSSSLDMDDFMKLLAMQLQNQDMNSPMSNSEMMGQLTSMATVQSMNTFSELSSTQYALNLIGQEVKVSDIDKLTNEMKMISGTVSGINLSNMTIFLNDNSKGYGLGNVMEIGTIKEAPENVLDTDGDGKPDAPDVDGDGKPDAPEKPGDPEKPDDPGNDGDGPGGGDGAGDKNEKSALRSRAAAPTSDGRAAAPSTTGATPGGQAASAAAGGITTLPDGRASTPVGRTAEDSGRTSAADRTTEYNDRAADVRAAGTRTTDNRAASNVRTTDGRVAATATNSRSTSDGRTSSGSRRTAPGGRNDAPGMAQDKIDALAAQSARTMPTDKAASLERDRQARSRVNHIGPGWWD